MEFTSIAIVIGSVLFYSPARQRPGVLCPGEEEGDVSGLNEGGADTVGQAGQLLQAVRVQPPVPDIGINIERS